MEYNEQNEQIDMVLFDMALEHLTRIHRVLKMDTGHIMLIGVGGSGKAMMTKLAAFTAGIIINKMFLNIFIFCLGNNIFSFCYAFFRMRNIFHRYKQGIQ